MVEYDVVLLHGLSLGGSGTRGPWSAAVTTQSFGCLLVLCGGRTYVFCLTCLLT